MDIISPLRKFKIILEYDGAAFNGWQTQMPGLRTVQNHVEEKLRKIFKRKVNCLACGRTDKGVHALAQTAHFAVATNHSPEVIFKALNTALDRDVSVIAVEEVGISFHAQQAKEKTYCYTILNRRAPSALLRSRAYYYPQPLNISWMKAVCKDIVGKRDFKVFQNASESHKPKSTVRRVKKLTVIKKDDLVLITITADGFLYKMVRNIVSALIAVGNGSIPKDSIPKILEGKCRKLNGLRTAPSHGLCLIAVKY